MFLKLLLGNLAVLAMISGATAETCVDGTATVCADPNADRLPSSDTEVCAGGTACTALKDLGTCCSAKPRHEITGSSGTYDVQDSSEPVCNTRRAKGALKFCPTTGPSANQGTCITGGCAFCTGYQVD